MTDAADVPWPRRVARAWRRWRPLIGAGAVRLGRLLLALLKVMLALLILFEEWGWRPLAELVGRLGRWRPFAALETFIIRLPPYAALVVFALPTLLLLPLKFVALLLISGRHVVAAGFLFVAAKLLATGLIARLFLLTQPSLMRISWFAAAYDTVIPWKESLLSRVHASWLWRGARRARAMIAMFLEVQWLRWRPAVLTLLRRARRVLSDMVQSGGNRLNAARRWLGRAISR